MHRIWCRRLILLAIASSLGACHTIEVVRPSGPLSGSTIVATNPVTPLQVKLLSLYQSDFTATLDGDPIGPFTPAAAPNVTVSTPGPDCFEGGTSLNDRGAPRATHAFIAKAIGKKTGSIELATSEMDFIPPGLNLTPRYNADVAPGNTLSVKVELIPGPQVDVQVQIVPDSPTVSINGTDAGQPFTYTLPKNTVGTFRLTGVSSGNYIVRLKARGVQCAAMSGRVG